MLCTLTFCALLAEAFAQGEHSRRAATELRVLAGDLRRISEESPSDIEKTGLEARINGSLAMLVLLLRLADNEQGKPPLEYRKEIGKIREQWDKRNIPTTMSRLQPLLEKFTLQFTISNSPPSDAQLRQASQLHQSLCAACHDHPLKGVNRPAYNLFSEAKTQPDEEFIARMLTGVKGDRVTGIDNPLSDIQLINMIQLYQSHVPE